MLKQLTGLLGSRGSIKTISYHISANHRTIPGQPAQIVGYTASNTAEVSVNDLTLIGRVIDTAVQAGANTVGGPRFTLQNPEPAIQQALTAAGKQARGRADAIAAGLNGRTGIVLTAEEGFSYTPIAADRSTTAAVPTPIQPGTLEISATVTIEVELL
jgi:uncharacterized protein YggE